MDDAPIAADRALAREGEGFVVDLEAQTPDGRTEKINAEYLLVATGRGPLLQDAAGVAGLEAGGDEAALRQAHRDHGPAAVAAGQALAFRFSVAQGLCEAQDAVRAQARARTRAISHVTALSEIGRVARAGASNGCCG